MPEHRFSDVMKEERERLHNEREQIHAQQRELVSKLAELDRELAAIDAYEAAKTGRATASARMARGGGTGTRARRGSKREQLIELISQHPQGLARKDILQALGLKGDKAGEMSVSNALTALTKTSQVVRADGKYRIGAAP